MKLNPEFMIQEVGERTVLVPVGKASSQFHGVIQMNQTAAFIVDCLKQETTEEQIKAALAQEYEGTDEEFTDAVKVTLAKLQECGALVSSSMKA